MADALQEQTDIPEGYQPLEKSLVEQIPTEQELPEGYAAMESERAAPGIAARITQRFLGTDVDDPAELTRLGTTVMGGVGGSIVGARTPVAPGPAGIFVNPVTGAIAGGIAGTVTGAVAPEATLGIAAKAGLIDEETRLKYSLSFEDLRTLAEGEALLELATGGTLTAARLIGRGTSRLLTGAGKEAQEIAEAAHRQGIELMPVQVGNRTIGRGYVAVMGRFPFLGGPIRKTGQAAEDALRIRLQSAPERIGPISNWSDVSERIFDDARDLSSRTAKYFDTKYTDLWKRADEMGVQVVPTSTLTKADEILAKIAKQTPRHITGPGAGPGAALKPIKDFIEAEILPMRAATQGGTITAKQSLAQMDGLVSKIDQQLASMEPSQRRFAQALMSQLRQAAQNDALVNLRGVDANEIGRAMRELDTEFSQTMSSLFETATANKFGSVRRRGIRGVTTDETTRTPVDQLARLIVKLDSPQSLDELSRIVSPDTMQRITAHVMDDAVSSSMVTRTGAGKAFDAEKFAKYLGLDKPTGDRRKVVTAMLEKANSPLTINDLDDMMLAARAIGDAEIPNVSSFIARRATIGGLQSVINGVLPGAALVSGAAYAGGTLFATAMMIGGGRLVSSIIANPLSARALKTVLSKEASTVVKREAYVRALRVGIRALMDNEEPQQPAALPRFNFMNDALDRAVKALDIEQKVMEGSKP